MKYFWRLDLLIVDGRARADDRQAPGGGAGGTRSLKSMKYS